MDEALTPCAIKSDAERYLDEHARAIALLNDHIFYFGELGMQEIETAGLMTQLLEEAGFVVERGLSGFPTGFCATYGSGAPVLAIHTEYDANPDNSQQPWAVEATPIVAGAPGHCEGHNCNGAVLVAAAIATRRAMEQHGVKGTLKVFGAPAEEQLVSRPYFVRDGHFDDVDLAITPHVGGEFHVGYGVLQSALVSATFHFHGETAHAGVAPWKGRDALDAVVLMDMGIAQYREHMTPEMNCQRVITDGGHQPNVTPRHAAVWWYFRNSTAEGVSALFEQAKKIAQGAALMTNTTLEVELHSAVWPVRGNETLARLVELEYSRIGAPRWSAEENAFAMDLQKRAGVRDEGLRTSVKRNLGPSAQMRSANDAGDVSWKTPMAKLVFPSNVPNISFHHWAAGAALATSIAHKGALAGAKVLACSLIECFTNPAVVEQARQSFARETQDTPYHSLLSADQKPPVHLNEKAMAAWRPAMKAHYLSERPHFS